MNSLTNAIINPWSNQPAPQSFLRCFEKRICLLRPDIYFWSALDTNNSIGLRAIVLCYLHVRPLHGFRKWNFPWHVRIRPVLQCLCYCSHACRFRYPCPWFNEWILHSEIVTNFDSAGMTSLTSAPFWRAASDASFAQSPHNGGRSADDLPTTAGGHYWERKGVTGPYSWHGLFHTSSMNLFWIKCWQHVWHLYGSSILGCCCIALAFCRVALQRYVCVPDCDRHYRWAGCIIHESIDRMLMLGSTPDFCFVDQWL